MIEFSYNSTHRTSTRSTCHIKTAEVRYYEKTKEHSEFICITSYDPDLKEQVELFIGEQALDSFIEQMSVICALRFKNKGTK